MEKSSQFPEEDWCWCVAYCLFCLSYLYVAQTQSFPLQQYMSHLRTNTKQPAINKHITLEIGEVIEFYIS